MTDTAAKTTPDDIRTRVEEIAVEAYVDTPDPNEPLVELIERVRHGIKTERQQMTEMFSELEAELDEFDKILPPNSPQAS